MNMEEEVERLYVKFPGGKPVDISNESRSNSVRTHAGKLRDLIEQNKGKKYRSSHNHPKGDITPSERDIYLFMENDKERASAIGKEGVGYFLLRKTKLTPQVINWDYEMPTSWTSAFKMHFDVMFRSWMLHRKVNEVCKAYEDIRENPASTFEQKVAAFDKVASTLHLQYGFKRNLKGYDTQQMESSGPINSTTSTILLSMAIIGIFLGLSFFSLNITGNIIAGPGDNPDRSGLFLLLIGLIAGFLWLINRKK